jgi:hypothetical protein
MAALQERNGSYRVIFRYRGKQHSYTLGKVGAREAENGAAAADQILLRIERQLLRVPNGADIVEFVRNGGRIDEETPPAQTPDPIAFQQLKERYLEAHRAGAMEESSPVTARIHLGHLGRALGDRFHVRELTLSDLQRHVNERAKKKYRGKAPRGGRRAAAGCVQRQGGGGMSTVETGGAS